MDPLTRRIKKRQMDNVADILIGIQGLYYTGLLDDDQYETINLILSNLFYSLTDFSNQKNLTENGN